MRDIKKMLDELGQLKFEPSSYTNEQNKSQPCYNLDQDLTLTLVAGYKVRFRHAIIKRWRELENNMPRIDFGNPAEAARNWALQYERAQQAEEIAQAAILTRNVLNDTKTATALNTSSQAVKKANKLERELGVLKTHVSIKFMSALYKKSFNWRLLKSTSIEMEMLPIEIFDANYGTVKAYHVEVWRETYAITIDPKALVV